jgi:hypothetical protein
LRGYELSVVAPTSPSIDVVLDNAKRSLAVQDDQIKALDAKANFSLATATLLTTAIAAVNKSVLDRTTAAIQAADTIARALSEGKTPPTYIPPPNPTAVQTAFWLGIAAALIYVLVIVSSFLAYRLREYRLAPDATKFLWQHSQPELTTKRLLAGALAKYAAYNDKAIADKVAWTQRTLILLVTEAVLLLLLTATQIFL